MSRNTQFDSSCQPTSSKKSQHKIAVNGYCDCKSCAVSDFQHGVNWINDKLYGFIEVLVPVTLCNIKCHYCYVIRHDNRTMKVANLDYTPQQIADALSPKRFGGKIFISFCGAGETLIPEYMVDLVYEVLKTGNYVNVTTNGTYTKAFDKIIAKIPEDLRPFLNISFSLHYLELKRLNMLERFFENIRKIKNAGCSILVQMQACDEYEPYYNEIKSLCMENLGALPQMVVTRKESKDYSTYQIDSAHTFEEYKRSADSFNSPLFDYTLNNFNVNRKGQFCYAGVKSYTLHLDDGLLRPCYCSNISQNIFKDRKSKIRISPVGCHCKARYCQNASHFISLGVLPGENIHTYADLRNRTTSCGQEWYTPQMKHFLSQRLTEQSPTFNLRFLSWIGWLKETVIDIRHSVGRNPLVQKALIKIRNA